MTTVGELGRQAYTPVGAAAVSGNIVPFTPVAPTAPVVAQPSEEELLEKIAPMLYSYHEKYDEAVEKSDKKQQLFMGFDGVYLRRAEEFNGNKLAVISKADKVPGLRTPAVGLTQVEINNKVPYAILKELIANFKAIYDRDTTESSAQIYRLKAEDALFPGKVAGDYVCYFPKQKNTSSNTNYSEDPEAIINLRQRHTIVMEAHSHAGFSAFFSGGDDNNEKSPLAYCVIGNFSTGGLSFAGRVKLLTHEKRLNVEELFEIPEGVTNEPCLLNLPEPSAMMLANAVSSTNYTKTQAEIEEERQKNGIVKCQPSYGGVTYTGGYTRNYYGGNVNYGRHYNGGGSVLGTEDWDYGKNYSYKTRAERRREKKNARRVNFDVEWIADNIDESEAIKLLNLLATKLEHKDEGGKQ